MTERSTMECRTTPFHLGREAFIGNSTCRNIGSQPAKAITACPFRREFV